MGVPDEREEFWFYLYGLTALNFLGVTLIPLARLVAIYDKKGNWCGIKYRPPGWLVFPLFILAHLGLLTPATFIFVDEIDPGRTEYVVVNWLVYVVSLLIIFWPHVYSVNFYSLKDWYDHKGSYSYKIITNVANALYPIILWVAFVLLGVAIGFNAAISGQSGKSKWAPFALYLAYALFVLAAAIYFTIEWFWCRSRYYREYAKGGDFVAILQTFDLGTPDETMVMTNTMPPTAYGYPKRGMGYGKSRSY